MLLVSKLVVYSRTLLKLTMFCVVPIVLQRVTMWLILLGGWSSIIWRVVVVVVGQLVGVMPSIPV